MYLKLCNAWHKQPQLVGQISSSTVGIKGVCEFHVPHHTLKTNKNSAYDWKTISVISCPQKNQDNPSLFWSRFFVFSGWMFDFFRRCAYGNRKPGWIAPMVHRSQNVDRYQGCESSPTVTCTVIDPTGSWDISRANQPQWHPRSEG